MKIFGMIYYNNNKYRNNNHNHNISVSELGRLEDAVGKSYKSGKLISL